MLTEIYSESNYLAPISKERGVIGGIYGNSKLAPKIQVAEPWRVYSLPAQRTNTRQRETWESHR